MKHRIRITKLTRHDGDVFTAHVTAAGADTVQVDNTIGCWTLPVDQAAELGAPVARREVLPWVVKLLNERVRGFLRGEAADESEIEVDAGGARPAQRPSSVPAAKAPAPKPPTSAEAIAQAMATAATNALKEAA